MATPQPGAASTSSPWWKEWLKPSTAVAILIILASGPLIVWMMGQVGRDEGQWNRLLYLYGTVEAILVGAAGVVLGTTVQVKRVADAKDQATEATRQASNAAKEAGEVAVKSADLAGRARALKTAAITARDKSRASRSRWVDLGDRYLEQQTTGDRIMYQETSQTLSGHRQYQVVPADVGEPVDPALDLLAEMADSLVPDAPA
jgi:hypothetical protein